MKFYGKVGYGAVEETSPNVWEETIKEVDAYGDVLQNIRKWVSDSDLNDDLTTQNRISLIASPFVTENMYRIKYLRWNRVCWKVTSVQLASPRIIVTLGGVYNDGTSEGHPEDD